MITIHANKSNATCRLSELQWPEMTQILQLNLFKSFVEIPQFLSHGVYQCIFESNATLSFSKKPMLMMIIPPSSMSKNIAKIIDIKSHTKLEFEPTLKCSTASKPTEPNELSYVCDGFNNINTHTELFHLYVQGDAFFVACFLFCE